MPRSPGVYRAVRSISPNPGRYARQHTLLSVSRRIDQENGLPNVDAAQRWSGTRSLPRIFDVRTANSKAMLQSIRYTCLNQQCLIHRGVLVKSTLIVAGLIGAASAGGFVLAAPASAACAPSFTSIPCTIVTNVAAAPAQTAASLAAAPGQLVTGLASTSQLVGVGCPEDDAGNTVPCGLPAVPGQLANSITTLPQQFAQGANQIATAPATHR